MPKRPYALVAATLCGLLVACTSKPAPAALDRLYSPQTIQADLNAIAQEDGSTREAAGKFISYQTATLMRGHANALKGRTYRQLFAYAQTLPADSFDIDTKQLPPGSFTPPPNSGY